MPHCHMALSTDCSFASPYVTKSTGLFNIIHRDMWRQMSLCILLNSLNFFNCSYMPISIAERSKACTVYDLLNIEIAGSNPARNMDVCPRVSVLCCPVCR
jgi:hypothetical protein